MTDSPVANAIVFAVLGMLVFGAGFSLAVKLAPFDLWKEIRERNTAAAILAGAGALGLAWIVASAMH